MQLQLADLAEMQTANCKLRTEKTANRFFSFIFFNRLKPGFGHNFREIFKSNKTHALRMRIVHYHLHHGNTATQVLPAH